MKKRYVKMTLALSAVAVLVSAGFFAGAAWAADAKLDSSVDFLVKARALLNASENPGVEPPFDYHRYYAVLLINRALVEVDLAKQYADATAVPPRQ